MTHRGPQTRFYGEAVLIEFAAEISSLMAIHRNNIISHLTTTTFRLKNQAETNVANFVFAMLEHFVDSLSCWFRTTTVSLVDILGISIVCVCVLLVSAIVLLWVLLSFADEIYIIASHAAIF